MTTSTQIHFRQATTGDAPALAELAAETFIETFGHLYKEEDLRAHLAEKCSAEFFRQSMKNGDDIMIVEDKGKLAGYCKMGDIGLPVAYPPKSAQEIHRIYVRKPYQQQGLGQQLLDRALKSPRLAEASVVYLGVWEENDTAKQFYYRNGFMPVGRYLYYVGKQADREIILAHVSSAQTTALAS